MNNLSGVEDHLFSTIHPYISKKTSVFAIVVSLMLAFLAIAMIVVSVSVDYFSTVMNMSLLTLGTILLLLALCVINGRWMLPAVVLQLTFILQYGQFLYDQTIVPDMVIGMGIVIAVLLSVYAYIFQRDNLVKSN